MPMANDAAPSPPPELGGEARLALLQSLRGSGQTMRLRTDGFSMSPMMETGAIVTIQFVPASDLRAGDMILFSRADRLVLHRLLHVKPTEEGVVFVEKGDHQPFATDIPAGTVLGRAIEVTTSRGTFRADSASGRRVTRRLLMVARAEHALYWIKVRVLGKRKTPIGQGYMRASRTVRRWLGAGTGSDR